jgi:hypothetical protein
MNDKVIVPRQILPALMKLRTDCMSSMSDISTVLSLLKDEGEFEAVAWIMANQQEYSKGVRAGFSPDMGNGVVA